MRWWELAVHDDAVGFARRSARISPPTAVDGQYLVLYFVDRFDRESGARMQWDIAAAGLVVGCVIGLTGMGGGALMTPVLVIFFHITPSAAISSDILASVVLKPIGGGVHVRRKTVNWRLVRWLSVGSVPAAFGGAYLIDRVASHGLENRVKEILGAVLLIAAAAMLVKTIAQARRPRTNNALMDQRLVRPVVTLAIGAVGGFLVGMTSVGSGSLIIVMLMTVYPTLSAREMVGTDLVQAVPLVAAAALGHILFGHLQLDLTSSVLVGAVPGVYIGARLSAQANDRYIRPLLVAVLAISSLKLLNASNGLLLAATAVAAIALIAWLVNITRHHTPQPEHAGRT